MVSKASSTKYNKASIVDSRAGYSGSRTSSDSRRAYPASASSRSSAYSSSPSHHQKRAKEMDQIISLSSPSSSSSSSSSSAYKKPHFHHQNHHTSKRDNNNKHHDRYRSPQEEYQALLSDPRLTAVTGILPHKLPSNNTSGNSHSYSSHPSSSSSTLSPSPWSTCRIPADEMARLRWAMSVPLAEGFPRRKAGQGRRFARRGDF